MPMLWLLALRDHPGHAAIRRLARASLRPDTALSPPGDRNLSWRYRSSSS
jgi:hypothetical protein